MREIEGPAVLEADGLEVVDQLVVAIVWLEEDSRRLLLIFEAPVDDRG